MPGEYILFNILILIAPLILSLLPKVGFRPYLRATWGAVVMVAIPFLIWDAWVAGKHWDFNPSYTLPLRIGGLPIGEILFFFTVPFACLFVWFLLAGDPSKRPRIASRSWLYAPILVATLVSACLFFWIGKQYTALVMLALASAAMVDRLTDARVLQHPRFPAFLAVVLVLISIFNGYLTGRPIVTYGVAYQLDLRIGTIPIEDFAYGIALLWLVTAVYERRLRGLGGLDAWIHNRFGGYRHLHGTIDVSLPKKLDQVRTVAVVGGGIAGIIAASKLAERGFRVHLFEKNDYLGGKIGGWKVQKEDGTELAVEHGFHAFFRQYYNLQAFLREREIYQEFEAIRDYAILTQDGRRITFAGIRSTPVLNLLSLVRKGMIPFREIALNPRMAKMEELLRYDPKRTPNVLDEVSFAQFAKEANLGQDLRLIFNSFSRAFFSSPEKMSMAELIKSFHFYFLGHDHGLLYDYPAKPYEEGVIAPLIRHLECQNVRIHLATPITEINIKADDTLCIRDEKFDDLVLACDVVGIRSILEGSSDLKHRYPRLATSLAQMKVGERYAVLRIWGDRDAGADLPVFVITDRYELLDSISFYHRIEGDARAWAAKQGGGGVYELHCYAVPDDFAEEEQSIRAQMLAELYRYLPALQGMKIYHEELQVRRNFSAFHTGLYESRPGVETEASNIFLAGDWVKLPIPAMLMEAAASSGLFAANGVLRRAGLQTEPIWTIPERGLLTLLKGT